MAPLAGEWRLPPAAAPATDPATPAGGSLPAEDASAADPDPAIASLAPGRGGSHPLAGRASEPEAGAADRANARHAPVAELAALIWLVAAAGLVLLPVWQRIGLSIRLGERRQLTGTSLNTSLDELRRATGVRRQVRLRTTASLSSPLALGLAEVCIPGAGSDRAGSGAAPGDAGARARPPRPARSALAGRDIRSRADLRHPAAHSPRASPDAGGGRGPVRRLGRAANRLQPRLGRNVSGHPMVFPSARGKER